MLVTYEYGLPAFCGTEPWSCDECFQREAVWTARVNGHDVAFLCNECKTMIQAKEAA